MPRQTGDENVWNKERMFRLCIHLLLCERLSKTAYAQLMKYAFESSSPDIVNHITVNLTALQHETCKYLVSQYLCLPLERWWLEKDGIQIMIESCLERIKDMLTTNK